MMLNITESTLNDALKHFDIEKLPTVWNGHFEFQDCIIKVQKNSATVYMSGRFDKSRPVKCRATIDHSKGVGGQVVKYLEIYPVIKDANVEPLKQDDEIIKLNDEDKTPKFPFILPEIKTLDEAREFIKQNGGETRGLANISEETARERISSILKLKEEQSTATPMREETEIQSANPVHPADEIDADIVQNELKDDDIIEGNEEKPIDL